MRLGNCMSPCCGALLAWMLLVGNGSVCRAQERDVPPKGWAESVVYAPGEVQIHLFNGKDLTGWEGHVDKHWTVKDGVILGRNTERVVTTTYLFTKEKFKNVRVVFEVKQNQGEGFASPQHSALALGGEKSTQMGEEFCFKGPLAMFCKDWGVYDVFGRLRLDPPGHRGVFQHPSEKAGDWNQVEVLLIGDRLRIINNGQLVSDFKDQPGTFKESPLGLQLHSNRTPQENMFRGLIAVKDPQDKLLTLKEAAKP